MGLYWRPGGPPFRGKRLAPAKPSGRGLTRLRLLRPRGAKQAQGAEGLGLRSKRNVFILLLVFGYLRKLLKILQVPKLVFLFLQKLKVLQYELKVFLFFLEFAKKVHIVN